MCGVEQSPISNEIRPVRDHFGSEDEIVLQIAVESTVETFAWVILDDEGSLVAGAEVDRRATPTSFGRGRKFSVTVTEKNFRYIGRVRGFQPGDYQVQLYRGTPSPNAKSPKTRFGKLDLLEEAAFSISERALVYPSPQRSSDFSDPVQVAPFGEDAKDEAKLRSPVTYTEFCKFLESEREHDESSDRDSGPNFGSRRFLALRDAARVFVSKAEVSSFRHLLPPSYVEGKFGEAASQFPTIARPLDTSSSFLPGVELIWNYWLEEGMLAQTLKVILSRFQNRRLSGRDPLARFDVTPLLPLRNRLWGYSEDKPHRLTVRRRAAEYEYEYGFSLIGHSAARPHSVVERRDGFIASFHQVLFLAHRYFKEVDDLTLQADAFPLYLALRDCHIVLSQGTQNQYGEMAVAARAEFLVMQSILAEPQMREFLGGRPMAPYSEAWMDRVDTMKSIQGWTDTSIIHFNDLAQIGEQLVLTIRLGNWADPAVGGAEAATWAQAFRQGIQKYLAAYRAATGVDLAKKPNAEVPSVLLARRRAHARDRA